MDLRTAVTFLPTPQAHDAQKGKTAAQVAAMRARGHGVSNLNELAENELVSTGEPTPLPSSGGNQSSDETLPPPLWTDD